MSRRLSPDEDRLIRWMLQNGNPEAKSFIAQLDRAEVMPWHCPCGCASINFLIDGHSAPSGKLHILADFLFGSEDELSGVFIFENEGILAGLEVYGLAGEAPKILPSTQSLRPARYAANKHDS
jgi:hypothetical protein